MWKYRDETGFTLIEIVLALVLLAIVIIPLAGYFSNSARVIRVNAVRSRALVLAQQTIEANKAADFKDIPLGSGIVNLANYPAFTVKVAGIDISSTIREITVEVLWHERGREKSLSLVTRIADR